MRIGVFTTIIVTLLFLLAILNSFWIGRLLTPSVRWKFRFAYGVLTSLAAAIFLSTRAVSQFDGLVLIKAVLYFGPFWTILQLMLLLAWPFSRIAGWWEKRRSVPQDQVIVTRPENAPVNTGLTRRAFLSRAAILPPMAMTGINAAGFLGAEFRTVLHRIDFAYSDLSPKLDGLKIGNLADVHIGPYISARHVKKMVDLLQQDSPDLLTITGDLVDDVSLLPEVLDMMKPFLASLPLGAWFCMGNHEHLRGAASIREILRRYGINILDNQHQRLPFRGSHFVIAGVDYPIGASSASRPETIANYLKSACENTDQDDFTVLMSHHPDALPAAFDRRIGLTLAGHTHGGQVGWGKRSAFGFFYPYMRGVYRQDRSFGFVSSGAGHWLPFRLNCPPEVSVLTLRKKA